MREVPIIELADVIRSKNSGPYELTLDIIFKNHQCFDWACDSGIFTKELFANLYNIDTSQVLSVIQFPQAHAIKATLVRRLVSGALGDSDVYGAQEHTPLLTIVVPCPDLPEADTVA